MRKVCFLFRPNEKYYSSGTYTKESNMKKEILLILSVFIAACDSGSSNLSGNYGGENCDGLFEFKSDGSVYIRSSPDSAPNAWTYEREGDKVILDIAGRKPVMTLEGDVLVSQLWGKCVKQ
jgi:hypothetical protein